MRTTVRVLAAASLAVAGALWAAGLPTAAPGVAAAGRLAALCSTDLLILQVLLMARIPWVERAFGQDTLARWHRRTGAASFLLLLAHVVLAVVASARRAGTDAVHQFVTLVLVYRGMLPALTGLTLLCAVVLTSVRPLRRRLQYTTWHVLHLYAYFGIALAIPHELWLGSDFGTPVARAFWWTMYAAALTCTIAFRLGVGVPAPRLHRERFAW